MHTTFRVKTEAETFMFRGEEIRVRWGHPKLLPELLRSLQHVVDAMDAAAMLEMALSVPLRAMARTQEDLTPTIMVSRVTPVVSPSGHGTLGLWPIQMLAHASKCHGSG